MQRRKCEHLITELVHQRDVLRGLIDKGTKQTSNFDWLYHMRFYLNESVDDPLSRLTVKMADAELAGIEVLIQKFAGRQLHGQMFAEHRAGQFHIERCSELTKSQTLTLASLKNIVRPRRSGAQLHQLRNQLWASRRHERAVQVNSVPNRTADLVQITPALHWRAFATLRHRTVIAAWTRT